MQNVDKLSQTAQAVITGYFGVPSIDQLAFEGVKYGFMAYYRCIVRGVGKAAFIKVHTPEIYYDDNNGTAEEYSNKDLRYLEQEADNLQYVNNHNPSLVPQLLLYKDGVMMIEVMDDCHWLAPRDALNDYVRDTMKILKGIETLPLGDYSDSTMQGLLRENWSEVNFEKIPNGYTVNLELLRDLGATAIKGIESDRIVHHDAHQLNIGWHPERGSRLVDFSRMDLGPANADATMLLIDLHKHGYNVKPFMDGRFNEQYAWLRAGNWLYRSTLPPGSSETVRTNQRLSARAALELLGMLPPRHSEDNSHHLTSWIAAHHSKYSDLSTSQ